MRRVLRALWSLLWWLLFLAFIAASVAGVYNVARDDFDVQQMAEAAACEGEGAGCSLQRFYVARGPLSETFEFLNGKQEEVRVRCAREHVLFGADACEVRGRRPHAGPVVVIPPRSVTPPKGNGGGARKPRPPASGSAAPSGSSPPPGSASPPTPERDGGSASP